MNREFVELDIDSVVIKSQRRKDPGDLVILENSIRRLGVLHPVIVGNGNVLIAGERRFIACRNVGLTKIPAVKIDIDFNSMTALNIQSDLNLCRQAFSTEELDEIIEMKKYLAVGKSAKENQNILVKIKNSFVNIFKSLTKSRGTSVRK